MSPERVDEQNAKLHGGLVVPDGAYLVQKGTLVLHGADGVAGAFVRKPTVLGSSVGAPPTTHN